MAAHSNRINNGLAKPAWPRYAPFANRLIATLDFANIKINNE